MPSTFVQVTTASRRVCARGRSPFHRLDHLRLVVRPVPGEPAERRVRERARPVPAAVLVVDRPRDEVRVAGGGD